MDKKIRLRFLLTILFLFFPYILLFNVLRVSASGLDAVMNCTKAHTPAMRHAAPVTTVARIMASTYATTVSTTVSRPLETSPPMARITAAISREATEMLLVTP